MRVRTAASQTVANPAGARRAPRANSPLAARLAAAAFGCLLVCLPSTASAGLEDRPDIPVHFAVVVSGNCPGIQAFVDRLRARSVRIREAREEEAAPSMQVALRGDGEEVLGRLTFFPIDGPLRGQELRREVRGTDCESVATSLTLVAAVILDPQAPANGGEADAPPSPPPPASRANPAPVQTWPSSTQERPAASARSPSAARFWFGAALEGALGLGPDPAVVPRAFADLELAVARVSLRLSFGHGYTRTVETSAGSAEITLTDLRLEPCLDVWSPSAWRMRACGVFSTCKALTSARRRR